MPSTEEQFRELIQNKRKLSTEELAYIAGFLDGEGWIGIVRFNTTYKILVTVTNTKKDMPYWLKENFGGVVRIWVPTNPNHKTRYTWVLNSHGAILFLNDIKPYVRQKSRNIEVALEFQETQHHGSVPGKWGYGSDRYTDDEKEYREYLYDIMSALNRRGNGTNH